MSLPVLCASQEKQKCTNDGGLGGTDMVEAEENKLKHRDQQVKAVEGEEEKEGKGDHRDHNKAGKTHDGDGNTKKMTKSREKSAEKVIEKGGDKDKGKEKEKEKK